MHELRKLVQGTMDQKGLRQTDVAKRGGISRQALSKILNDARPELTERPTQRTVNALAKGLGISPDTVLAAVARAMGLPLTATTARLEDIPDDALLHELRRRLTEGAGHRGNTAPMNAEPQKQANPSAPGDRGDRTFDLSPTRARSEANEKSVTTVTRADFDLAAHPDFELTRDRQDRQWADIGEESQDHGDHNSA